MTLCALSKETTTTGIVNEAHVFARVFGGLGNQLFIYAAARSLASARNVPLLLDITSAFVDDRFGRSYLLNHFDVRAQPYVDQRYFLGRSGALRLRVLRLASRLLPAAATPYLDDFNLASAEALYTRPVRRRIVLNGYWQSCRHFLPYRTQIAAEFRMKSTFALPLPVEETVAVHVRQLDISEPLGLRYYQNAFERVREYLVRPRFFVFSDDPAAARSVVPDVPDLEFYKGPSSSDGLADFAVMRSCKHLIMANSTFSWWVGWLNEAHGLVVAPADYPLARDTLAYAGNWQLVPA